MEKKDVNIFKQKILNIGARLKEARIKAGFSSARAFALVHNIKPRTYQNHESGQFEASITTIIKYSQLLNVSYMWLCNGMPNYKNRPYLQEDVDSWFKAIKDLNERINKKPS
jgi:DNA-binding XRE family transcriptional regulator